MVVVVVVVVVVAAEKNIFFKGLDYIFIYKNRIKIQFISISGSSMNNVNLFYNLFYPFKSGLTYFMNDSRGARSF